MKGIITTSLAIVLFAIFALAEGATGEALYKKKCVSCHGQDGKGKALLAKMFKIEPEELDLTAPGMRSKSDEELLKVISEGSGKMPGYAEQLTQDEQVEVLKYIRQLAEE